MTPTDMPMRATFPICRASVIHLLAGADTASARPRRSLAPGRNGNAVVVSVRAMHIGSDHREHWRALASLMLSHATTSIAANEQSP
jgi:hypothetical protein